MSNVLLCFLGKGEYKPIYYALSGQKTEQPERYVPAALVQLLDKSEMHVRALVTKEARTAHWQSFSERLSELGVDGTRLTKVDIEIPTTETALWTLFEKALENLNEDDIVWLDITHGFRALPVVAVLALTFARNVKRVTIEGLLYGAFEAGDESTAPIFDLTAMMTLPAWSEALAEWKRTGRADGLVQQTEPYLNQVRKQNRQATALTGIPEALQQVSNALTMVRHDAPGDLAERAVGRLSEAEAELQSHSSMTPLRFILGPLKWDIQVLSGAPTYDKGAGQDKAVVIDAEYLRRLVETGKWFLERKRAAEASTTLRETITACAVRLVRHGGVNEILVRHGGVQEVHEDVRRYIWHHEKYRASVDWGLQVLSGAERMPKGFDTDAPQHKAVSEKLTNDELRDAARVALERLRPLRNKVNHAWTSGEHTRETFNEASATAFFQTLHEAALAVDNLVELTIAATENV